MTDPRTYEQGMADGHQIANDNLLARTNAAESAMVQILGLYEIERRCVFAARQLVADMIDIISAYDDETAIRVLEAAADVFSRPWAVREFPEGEEGTDDE